uniref:BTB-domain-containing protein n=2 Tax=Rhizophagus irregularis TaxID=588596 RepID=U9TTQ1_RHIID
MSNRKKNNNVADLGNNCTSAEQTIILNVGGIKYETRKSTLVYYPDTLLGTMFADRNQSLQHPKNENEYFLDHVSSLPSSYFPSISFEEIEAELDYFQIPFERPLKPSSLSFTINPTVEKLDQFVYALRNVIREVMSICETEITVTFSKNGWPPFMNLGLPYKKEAIIVEDIDLLVKPFGCVGYTFLNKYGTDIGQYLRSEIPELSWQFGYSQNREQLKLHMSITNKKADDHNVLIEVGQEKTFRAHSSILRARSEYFHTALSNDWLRKEGDMIIFKKPNISYNAFNIILRYIYSGTIYLEQLEDLEIFKLIEASDELCLFELFNHVQDYLITYKVTWLQQNIFSVIQVAFDHESCEKLRKFCLNIINENAWNFFKSEELLHISETVISRLLKKDDLGIEEIDIWGFLIKWGIENSDVPAESDLENFSSQDFSNLEKTLHNLLPLIRFFNISSKDFYHKVWPFELILPKKLRQDLLSYYLTGEEPKYTEIQVARITPKNLDSEIISSKHAILISSYIEGKNNNSTSSSLPLTIPHSSHLIKDDGVNIPYRFKLIYRGSRDGFSFESFHKNVDNHGPTAVFIKIADSYEIIGGYNPIGWYSYGNYIATGDSFIFSMTDLDDEDISLLQFDSEQQQSFGTMLKISKVRPYFIDGAIFDTQFHGPCFGYGDIWFGHKSRPRYGSCTKVYYEQNIRDNEEEFYVEEIEVFQIIENNFL